MIDFFSILKCSVRATLRLVICGNRLLIHKVFRCRPDEVVNNGCFISPQDNHVVGVGSGSTIVYAVDRLGTERLLMQINVFFSVLYQKVCEA